MLNMSQWLQFNIQFKFYFFTNEHLYFVVEIWASKRRRHNYILTRKDSQIILLEYLECLPSQLPTSRLKWKAFLMGERIRMPRSPLCILTDSSSNCTRNLLRSTMQSPISLLPPLFSALVTIVVNFPSLTLRLLCCDGWRWGWGCCLAPIKNCTLWFLSTRWFISKHSRQSEYDAMEEDRQCDEMLDDCDDRGRIVVEPGDERRGGAPVH